jgi:ribose transport system substrate-binding protein
MRTFLTGRPDHLRSRHSAQRRLLAAGAIVVAGTLAAAGCSKTAGTSAGNSGSQVVSDAALASLKSQMATAEAVPSFAPPGPAFDASKAKGKTIIAVPSSSEIPYCAQTIQQMVSIGQSIGVPVTNYTANDPTAWAQAAQEALSTKAGAFTTICGIDPSQISPQISALHTAKIPVVTLLGDVSLPAPSTVSGGTSIQLDKAADLDVDDAVVNNDGKPFHTLVLTDYDIYGANSPTAAAVAQLKKLCGTSCPATVMSVPIPDWTTTIESTVSGALLKDPKITSVICLYDGMVAGFLPAVQGAHRADLKIYTYGASQGVVDMITSTHGVVATDVGAGAPWTAYTQMDQVLRVMAGEPALPTGDEYPALRMWVPSNASQFNGSNPYGTSYASGFMKLWQEG